MLEKCRNFDFEDVILHFASCRIQFWWSLMRAGAVRVIRAVTWLTVYRTLQVDLQLRISSKD